MSNAGLGLRDPLEREEAHRKSSRSTNIGTRAPAAPGAPRAYAPRAPRPYASARTRIDADGVRTVKIRGQATPPRRRPAVPVTRYDQHPDRAAQWALFLGVFMVIVAIVTGS